MMTKKKKKKKKKKNKKNSYKIKKNKKLETSLSSGGESNCDTNGESFHFFFENDDTSYEKNLDENKIKEDRKKSLERFIECFNGSSKNINLNTSFEDEFDFELKEEGNQYINNQTVKYKNSL